MLEEQGLGGGERRLLVQREPHPTHTDHHLRWHKHDDDRYDVINGHHVAFNPSGLASKPFRDGLPKTLQAE